MVRELYQRLREYFNNLPLSVRNAIRKISVMIFTKAGSTAASVPWHGTTNCMYSWNFPRTAPLSRRKEPVTRRKAGTTGRVTYPRKIISAIPANLPSGTSVTGPYAGRTPRNTWGRRAVNPYRMKTGYGISEHRHTGYRYC